MMYVIFNNQGAIKEKQINELVVQGSNNTNKIGVVIEGTDSTSYAIVGVCKLPNGEVITTTPSVEQAEIKDGVYGVVFSLTEDITALAGTLRINLQAINVNTDKVITSYTVFLCVNEGVDPGEILMMTAQQYQNLVAMIEADVQQDETILTFSTLPEAENYSLGQVIYVKTENKLYECVENDNEEQVWHETFDFNDHYTIAATDALLDEKQDLLTEESLETANLQYAIGFDSQGNLRKGQGGGGGATYTAGNGISISDFTISIDDTVVETKENANLTYERLSNKTTSLSGSSTDAQYPSAKCVYDNLVDIREVAEGKCKTSILTYDMEEPTALTLNFYRKQDGSSFTDLQDYEDYVDGLTLANSSFNSQNDTIGIENTNFLILTNIQGERTVIKNFNSYFKLGDIILIVQMEVPDRWFMGNVLDYFTFAKLETSKVDLTGYYTKSQTNGLLSDEYDNTVTYAVGDYVIYNNTLYRCTTAVSVAEDFDSTKWTACKIADVMVDLDSAQTITGEKTFSGEVVMSGHKQFSGYTDGLIVGTTGSDLTIGTNPRPVASLAVADILLKGGLRTVANTTYYLTFPNTSSFTADKEIATTDKLNVIELTNTDLTTPLSADVMLLLKNKITMAENVLGFTKVVFFPTSTTMTGGYCHGCCVGTKIGTFDISILQYRFNGAGTLLQISDVYGFETRITKINGKAMNHYLNNVYPYATNSTTVLQYETINNISVSANTTFTLATAPANTYPEYKANITNSGANAITITLPSGTVIKTNDSNITVSSNTFTLPADVSVELNIQNGKCIVFNWSAN